MHGGIFIYASIQKFTKIYINMMYPCVFIIFSHLLLHIEGTTANQLVAVGEEGREDDNGAVKKCLDKERLSLLHFKAGLQDPYGHLSTWTAGEDDCCRWFGVTCNNQTGHVTELEIRDCGLEGEISHSLLNLSHLNHLDLSHNSFHGPIPKFIGSMTRLSRLYLNSNNLNGTIPNSIVSLTELRYLDLSNNSLYGTIPPEFGNLTNLQGLYLGSVGKCRVENLEWLSRLSHLQGLDMGEISLAKQNHWVNVMLSLPKLSYLSLIGCELSQVMYPYSSSFLESSSSIKFLDLRNNNLTSSMYRWLYPLTANSLYCLDLSSNLLDGIPKYLGNLCSLECLYFDNNSAVVKFPDFLNNLSGCTSLSLQWLFASGSQLTGSLSDDIQKFSSLEILDLSYNQLNGTISDRLWELPKLQTLYVSSNYLRGAISKNIGKSKLSVIDLSEDSLGPSFPKWIQTLKNLTYLDIANNGISDTIPQRFWDIWPSQIQFLNLSSNNITGKVPDLSSNFDNYSVIDLSFNNFSGLIPNVSSTLTSLNLSNNKFYGGIFFLCEMADGFLKFLDLSNNFLTGKLPDCLWHFRELKVLNLGNNNLSGKLPTSVESLIKLEALYLYNNFFFGELPLFLKNCTNLNSLNLRANKFSGNVPAWIGENLSGLYVLILRSNNFFGTIPSQFCQLAKLQILDLSMNNLHGPIPSCLNNLTSMAHEGLFPVQNIHSFSVPWEDYGEYWYTDYAMIEWQGDEHEFFSNLRLLKMIDLSSNNLTGHIPYELTNLYELVTLNLSKNALLGEIPRQIGMLKNLVSLDLSRNNLSGGIPSGMTQMTFLGYLDLSFNNLSGRIPSSTQLQSFQPSRYDGNAGLCGPPLTKKCPGNKDLEVPPVVGKSEADDQEDKDELWGWFYIGVGTGFATGFWIACGALLLNCRVVGDMCFSTFMIT